MKCKKKKLKEEKKLLTIFVELRKRKIVKIYKYYAYDLRIYVIEERKNDREKGATRGESKNERKREIHTRILWNK